MFWKKSDPQWEKGIKHLASYRRVNGDAEVPIMYVCADGFRLGSWLHGQKRIGKRLTPERLKALAQCGVAFN